MDNNKNVSEGVNKGVVAITCLSTLSTLPLFFYSPISLNTLEFLVVIVGPPESFFIYT